MTNLCIIEKNFLARHGGLPAHPCNPCYYTGDQEARGLRPLQTKSEQDPVSINKLGVVVCICHSCYLGKNR
jgi:hypothetical protein